MSHEPFVRADRVTARIRHREILAPVSLTIGAGERWTIVGPNGSGKSTLAAILAGVRRPYSGAIAWPAFDDAPTASVAHVSFEQAERLLERTRREDLSPVMHGRTDEGVTVAGMIGDADRETIGDLVNRFGLTPHMQRGIRFLSTGELRKTILVAALARGPRLLVVDDPYDGLDASARRELAAILDEESSAAPTTVIVVGRRREVPLRTTHVVELADGSPRFVGEIAAWREARAGADLWGGSASAAGPSTGAGSHRPGSVAATRVQTGVSDAQTSAPIVRMRGVSVSYRGQPVLRDVSWTVAAGDRWLVTGPNGAGKSTLLSLVTGDNPKAYGQAIDLFGRRRGSGETVDEIRRRIGLVSGDLHLRYPTRTTVEETVLSGFHDTVGLFAPASGHEREVAQAWIARMGLTGRERTRLRGLSFGMRRAVLVARALVKQPPLLIADEPTQGLDDEHSELVLELLDEYAARADGALVFVTHDPMEIPSCITHHLRLEPGDDGSRAVVE